MNTLYKKKKLQPHLIRRYLEPGPIVLISSQYKDQRNIMTLGWQTVMEFSPSLVGCMITSTNYSFELIRKSKECVINIPEIHLAKTVVRIGNCSGTDTDKFEKFELTAFKGKKIKAPLIKECYANFECKLYDSSWVNKYNFFVFEVVHATVANSPQVPKTIHYRGDGEFLTLDKKMSLKRYFLPDRL